MNAFILKRYYSYIEPCNRFIFDQIILFSWCQQCSEWCGHWQEESNIVSKSCLHWMGMVFITNSYMYYIPHWLCLYRLLFILQQTYWQTSQWVDKAKGLAIFSCRYLLIYLNPHRGTLQTSKKSKTLSEKSLTQH